LLLFAGLIAGGLAHGGLHFGEVVGNGGRRVDVVGVDCAPAAPVDCVDLLQERHFGRVALLPFLVEAFGHLAYTVLDDVEEDKTQVFQLKDLPD
jgi:hypothetical protein